ncbi:MAG: AIPR family protein [Candidatus Entotheonellia bacterium]
MIRETPLEITHLRTRLRQDFRDKLPEVTFGSGEEKERNFLSRALAAFAIQRLSGCSIDEAVAAVVDGGGDNGIDGIQYSPTMHRLWVVQSKFFADGQGEPSLADVSKFKNGLEALLQGQFDVFRANARLAQKIPQLQAHFDDTSLEVRAVLVYSGIHLVSEDRIHLFEDLRRRFSGDSEYFAFQRYNLTSVHGWLTGADKKPGVELVEITLYQPAQVSTPFETYYGLISLVDVATLYATYGKTLVAANIRNYKGSTEVNEQILATIREEPQHFFYLNNGLTAYCERIEVHNLDRGNTQEKRLKAYGFSIANGAQTVGSVAAFFETNPQPPPQGHVFLKIISLQRSPDEQAFAQRIIQSTTSRIRSGLATSLLLTKSRRALPLILSYLRYATISRTVRIRLQPTSAILPWKKPRPRLHALNMMQTVISAPVCFQTGTRSGPWSWFSLRLPKFRLVIIVYSAQTVQLGRSGEPSRHNEQWWGGCEKTGVLRWVNARSFSRTLAGWCYI